VNVVLVLGAIYLVGIGAFQVFFAARVIRRYDGAHRAHLRVHVVAAAAMTAVAVAALVSSKFRLELVVVALVAYAALRIDARWLSAHDDTPPVPLTPAQAEDLRERARKVKRHGRFALACGLITVPLIWAELGWAWAAPMALAVAAGAHSSFVTLPRLFERAISRRGVEPVSDTGPVSDTPTRRA
jgi:4-amino-4-deoxy-L-arabinose transferase-like glycosyltransferase